MLKIVLSLGCAAFLTTTSLGFAAEPIPDPKSDDLAAIQKCMSSAKQGGGVVETCIGVVADKCSQAAGASPQIGTLQCSTRERAVWDQILGDDYEKLRKTLSASASDELRDAQRIWIQWRDAKCKFADTLRTGPTGRPAEGRCLLEETARRSADVMADLKLAKAG